MTVTNGLEYTNDEEKGSFIFENSFGEKDWLKENEAFDIWDW